MKSGVANVASRQLDCAGVSGVWFAASSLLNALSPICPGTFGARTSAPARSRPSKVFSSIVEPFRFARRTSAPCRSTLPQSKLSLPSWPEQLAIRTSAPPVSALRQSKLSSPIAPPRFDVRTCAPSS